MKRNRFKTDVIQRYLLKERVDDIAKSENVDPMTIYRFLEQKGIQRKKSVYMQSRPFVKPNLSLYEIAYIAGLFDGEGTLFKQQTKMWQLIICNTHRETIEWLYRKIKGGGIYKKTKIHKATKDRTLYWVMSKQRGVYWLVKRLKLFCKIKRKKILECLKDLKVLED